MEKPNSNQQRVEAMFNDIAHRYDLLNHLLSFGIHKLWRKRLVNNALLNNPAIVLDVATGTAGVAIDLAKNNKNVSVVGVDIAENMLAHGLLKAQKLGLEKRISMSKASAEDLPYSDNYFNACTVAYGVRNFSNPLKGLQEIFRVTIPGGEIHVLEFVNPRNQLMRWIYGFYFRRILPFFGRIISGHKGAYSYLPQSVKHFVEREEFVNLLGSAGFVDAHYSIQSFGIAAIYKARKPLINN